MTIDEAIKTLTSLQFGTIWPTPQREKEAIKLGIEALKVRQAFIEKYGFENYILLPGETKAVDQRIANIGYGSSEALKKQRR